MIARILLSIAAAGLLAACGDDDESPATTTGQITFRGDTTFNGPHAGQPLRAALVRASDGATLDVQKTTVATAGTNPAFSVTFAPMVDLGVAHEIHYWADHNGNGECDAPPADHQWLADAAAGETTVTVAHSTAFTPVCDTLTFPLTFVADGTFNGPHAGQEFAAALVAGDDTSALDVQGGTIAAAGASPALSVTFGPRLFVGDPYSVKLWADHNSSGACDAPPADHQWSVDIPTAPASLQETFTYGPHNTTFTNVCSFLP